MAGGGRISNEISLRLLHILIMLDVDEMIAYIWLCLEAFFNLSQKAAMIDTLLPPR